MGESVDVKALRAKFNSRTNTSDTSSRDSSSPKSPRPGFGRVALPVTENDLSHHRLSPVVPPPLAGPGLPRFPVPPRVEPMMASVPRQLSFSHPPPNPSIRASVPPADLSRIKQTGEMLQNMMLMHQRLPGTKLAPNPAPASKPQQLTRQRATAEVTPLRRPLPTEGPRPIKPKRPPFVNLEPFVRKTRSSLLPDPKNIDGFRDRKISVPTLTDPPQLPQRCSKPSKLPRQLASVDIEDLEDTYDDIASFDNNDSMNDSSSQYAEGESDEVYEFIDEDQVEVNRIHADKKPQKDAKKQQQQEKKEQQERQKRENELRKNFQLQGKVEILNTARVRHDWHGGSKLDLSVQQGETVEVIRVKNNPGGKWLVRSLTGNYGYISNTCVDIDYEEVKRKLLQARKPDTNALPPPPPDPPQTYGVESSNNTNSVLQEEDEYDDVQPMSEDFPPPPVEISIDPKVEKELRKKFKYNGPIRVLHTMMVDPNGIIKKAGGKDLPVTQGEIVDVIEVTNNKKVLCRNQYGKYGFVSRSLLLPMEGDIYDDVDYAADVYDNDSLHNNY